MKKIHQLALTATLIIALALPQAALALTDVQINAILGLLRSFDTEEEIVQNVSNTLTGQGSSSNVQYEDTLQLSRTLSRGMRGSDIERLQRYLQGVGDYDEVITGYYGVRTEEAVQRWQARNGIVSSGSPSTTGYGAVGPSTRAALTRAAQRAVTVTVSPQVEDVTPPAVPSVEDVLAEPTPEIVEVDIKNPENPIIDGFDDIAVSLSVEPKEAFEGPGIKGDTVRIDWISTNAQSCRVSFNQPVNTDRNKRITGVNIILGSVFGTSSQNLEVIPINIRNFTVTIKCQGKNGLSVSDSATVVVKPVLPSGTQKGALLSLAKSFNAKSNTINLFEKVLDGELVQEDDPRIQATKLTESQIRALLDLMQSFGLSTSVILSAQNVLRGTENENERNIKEIVALMQSFGASSTQITLAEQALRGEIFKKGDSRLVPSSLTAAQIQSLIDLAKSGTFSSSIIDSFVVVLHGKENNSQIVSRYILGSSSFKATDPEVVRDPILGNLMYFIGGSSDVPRKGVYMAPGCPNGSEKCVNTVKVMDFLEVGLKNGHSPTLVTLNDQGSGRDYHIMYFSASRVDADSSEPSIYYSTSWAGDGVNWSAPKELMTGYSHPEAIRDFMPDFGSGKGEVLVFANRGNSQEIVYFRASQTGVNFTGPFTLSLPGGNLYRAADVVASCDGEKCHYSLYAERPGRGSIYHFQGVGSTPAQALTRWSTVEGEFRAIGDEKTIASPTHLRNVYGYQNQSFFYSDTYGYVKTRIMTAKTFASSFLGKFVSAIADGARSVANTFTSIFSW